MNAGIKAVTLRWPVAKYVITPIRIRAAPNATVNRAIGSLLHSGVITTEILTLVIHEWRKRSSPRKEPRRFGKCTHTDSILMHDSASSSTHHPRNILLHASYASRSSHERLSPGPIGWISTILHVDFREFLFHALR